MKKLLLIIMVLSSTLTVSSCGSKETKPSDDKTCADGKCEGNKCADQQIQTPDLTLFNLKGNVKSVTDEAENTYNFTKEGKLELSDSQIKRDGEGRIISYTINDLTTEVSWGKDGNVEGTKGVDHTTTHTYDDRGLLLTSYTEVDSWELSIYRYLKFDDKGNWIERERSWLGLSPDPEESGDPVYKNKEVEKRTIVYY